MKDTPFILLFYQITSDLYYLSTKFLLRGVSYLFIVSINQSDSEVKLQNMSHEHILNYFLWVRAKDASPWRRANVKLLSWNSLQWPIYVINSVDLPCYIIPLTQHHSTFLLKLAPSIHLRELQTVMDHYMTKITFCLLFWMIPLDGGKCNKNTSTVALHVSARSIRILFAPDSVLNKPLRLVV